jgi:photosystem II stability/assembly factor-like uncharacterized protein
MNYVYINKTGLMSGMERVSLWISSFLFFVTTFSQDNTYIICNKYAPVIRYTADKCYSRSISVRDSLVYTVNSNGSMFVTNIHSKESKNVLENRSYQELRDLFVTESEVVAVQSGTNGLLIRTNGTQYLDEYPAEKNLWNGIFLDGIDLHDSVGFLMGDPVAGHFNLFLSTDSGKTWNNCKGIIDAADGEVGFAASGTNVQVLNDSTFFFVTGGKTSRFFKTNDGGNSWKATYLPFLAGESSGAFSICMINDKEGVIVGGDYKNPSVGLNSCFYSNDGGGSWQKAKTEPRGYRSCVIYNNGVFYACGLNGIDYSMDKGAHWNSFADGTFMAMCTDSKNLYATCQNGSFQLFELIQKQK